MLPADIIYDALTALIIFLAVVFVFLLGYTFWTREKIKYWNRYKKKFRDYFLPMLFSFVEGEPDQDDADELIRNLTKRTQDISFFLELLDEMSDLLKGRDREKLDLLIEHPMFHRFYKKKLYSYSQKNQLLACIYFGNMSAYSDRTSARLVTLSRTRNLKLSYAATKALQASDNIIVRRNALISFLKRKDITDLMVSELLHHFHREGLRQQKLQADALKDVLQEDRIPADKKNIIVLYFAYENFYEESEFLLDYLNKIRYSPSRAPLVKGLVEAIGELHIIEGAPIIREHMKIQDVELRQKCVEALGLMGGRENLAYLTELLLQIQFSVRKSIIQILVHSSDLGHNQIKQFLADSREYVEEVRQKESRSEELREAIDNIYSTVDGIRIILSKKVAEDHA